MPNVLRIPSSHTSKGNVFGTRVLGLHVLYLHLLGSSHAPHTARRLRIEITKGYDMSAFREARQLEDCLAL